MQISPASLSDLPQLVALLGYLFDQEEDFRPSHQKQESGLRMILEDPSKGMILVAHEGGQILGMVNLLSMVSTAEGGKVLFLEDLVVLPEKRKHGLGQALLTESVAYAKREGFLRISLLTDHLNARAQALYARFGFKHSSMTLMRLHLGEEE